MTLVKYENGHAADCTQEQLDTLLVIHREEWVGTRIDGDLTRSTLTRLTGVSRLDEQTVEG